MSIFNFLFGDKELADLDQRIERFISGLRDANDVKAVRAEEISSSILDTIFSGDDSEFSINRIFDSLSLPRDRLERYNVYEEIYRVPMIKRIIRVYQANILQKNPVTGKCLIVREKESNLLKHQLDTAAYRERKRKAENFVSSVVDYFRLTEKLSYKIVPLMCLYGDVFVELVDVSREKVDFNKISYLQEQQQDVLSDLHFHSVEAGLDKLSSLLLGEVIVESGDAVGDLRNIVMKIHKPHRIIILESDYGTRLGYLEVMAGADVFYPDVGRTLAAAINRLSSLQGRQTRENLVNRLVGAILRKIASKVKSADLERSLEKLGGDTYNFLRRLVVEQGLNKKSLTPISVRFIPVNRMVQFKIVSSENDPYGASIVDPLVLPSKLYIISQLSNIINKLSRASLVRTWTIDTGSSLMHTNLIQQLKRELYNSRITLEDLSSFKSLPKLLSDFKDMFIFSKAGTKYVDVNVSSFGDPAIKVADLEDARREIIAISGIPAPYLGYMDVVELREQLVHSNVSFATEIVDIQESIGNSLNQVVDIIAQLLNYDFRPSEYVEIACIPPVVLILQLIEMTLASIGNILSVFNAAEISFDPFFFLNRFCPYIDWETFRKVSSDAANIKKIKSAVENMAVE